MVERVNAEKLSEHTATKVWNVHDFCLRHRLRDEEERRLTLLFGAFATSRELLHNAKRAPKWR